MADAVDQPSSSDVDVDKSELKVVGSKQRLAKQAEVEVMEETEQTAGSEGQPADNGEDQSPNSDESDRTVVDTGQPPSHFHIIELHSSSPGGDTEGDTVLSHIASLL